MDHLLQIITIRFRNLIQNLKKENASVSELLEMRLQKYFKKAVIKGNIAPDKLNPGPGTYDLKNIIGR